MSSALDTRLTSSLRDVVGPAGVITEPDRLLVYESDGLTAYRFVPSAVVLPTTTAQVAEVVSLVTGHGLPVVPRGAGTGLSGGAAALNGAVVVATPRMNRILEVDPPNRRARVQPGVINAHLTEAARPHGLYYAPDPSSQSACTIGGNVAENSGGPHCLKYGVTSRYVTGLTVVLSGGRVVELGGMAREPATPDLVGAFVGSEGCFGIATEIEVRLLPRAPGVRTLLAIFDAVEDAGRAVTAIFGQGLLPAALEIIDGATIRAVEASVFRAGYPTDAGAALVVELDGVDAGLDAQAERAEAACREMGATEVQRARDPERRAALWRGRKKAFGAMGRIAPDLLVQDATVPRTRLPGVLSAIGEIGRQYDLNLANVFHAGDGNLHPNILFDRRDPDQVARAEQASAEIMRVCVDAGGTITGEHGVGVDKRKYMSMIFDDAVLAAMARVRRAFDPTGLLNPGKVLPDGVEEETPAPDASVGPAPGAEVEPGERRDTSARAPDVVQPRLENAVRAGPVSHEPAPPDPAPLDTAPLDALVRLLGSDAVRTGADARPWRTPGPEPAAVALPGSASEAAQVLGMARGRGWRVVPAGGGAWLDGALAPPADAGPLVVLSSACLDAPGPYEPADLTVTAGAGMTLDALDGWLAPHGQWLPLDPPGSGAATLGAVLATGAAGPLSPLFGGPRDLVLGLEVATPAGQVLSLGGRVVKNVAGFDLVRLMVGSWGTLGLITSVTLRTYPRPRRDVTLVLDGLGWPAALERAGRVAGGGAVPGGVQVEGRGGGDARVVVRLLGAADEVEALAGTVRGDGGGRGWTTLEGPPAAELRRDLRSLESGADVALRARLLPSRAGELPDVLRALADAECVDALHWVYDAGRGTCRIALDGDAAADAAWSEALRTARGRMEELGGSLRLTRAPGDLGRAVGCWGGPDPAAFLVREVRRGWDPTGVLPWERFEAEGVAP